MEELTNVKIFISYSSEDTALFRTFKNGIEKQAKNSPNIKWDLWSDVEIPVGSEWHEVIQNSVKTSSAVILLVSANFLASDYIKDEEFAKFIDLQKKNNITLFPILLSDCDVTQWKELSKKHFFKSLGRDYGVEHERFKNKITPYDYIDKSQFKNTYHRDCVDAFEKAIQSNQSQKTTQMQNNVDTQIYMRKEESNGIEIFPIKNDRYKELIKNAPKDSEIKFISITAESNLCGQIYDIPHFKEAFNKNIHFKGIVLDPNGEEARFRSSIETPGKILTKTILYKGAENVKNSLKSMWKSKNIKIRYAKAGISFKLWLSDDEAIIEPYHIGKAENGRGNGLCGFSQILCKKGTEEYNRLKSHFEELWNRATPFWPEKKTKNNTLLFNRVEIEINTGCDKEEPCSHCPNKKKEEKGINENMRGALYRKIINELVGLEFSGRISFHFYGETLVCEDLYDRIEYAKNKFKEKEGLDVELAIYTNGDKLDQTMYDNLVKAGISKIFISIAHNELYTKEFEGEKHIILDNIHYDNRGGNLYKTNYPLEVPCFAPTHRLVITHDGNIILCYSDVERTNIFGNINNESIEDIWQKRDFNRIRESLAKGNRKDHKPCEYCNNQVHTRFGKTYVNYF